MKVHDSPKLCTVIFGLALLGCHSRDDRQDQEIAEIKAQLAKFSGSQMQRTLDKERALKVLLADNNVQKGLCYRYGLTRHTDTQYTASEYADKCLADLETAGLIHRGDCLQPGDKGCMERVITAQDGAAFGSNKTNYFLQFTCARLTDFSVKSVTTQGRIATIAYTRIGSQNTDLLNKLTNCVLEKPQAGIQERNRTAEMDDDGNWRIVPPR